MKLRQFFTLMGMVALVAIIYSPSTIGISAGGGTGGTGPTNTSQDGTSMFVSYLKGAGYHVIIANNTQQTLTSLNGQRFSYLLIGPDLPLTQTESQTLSSVYQSGRVSLLIAEGNKTNRALIQSVLGANVTGSAIVDPASAFKDKRVFTVALTLGSTTTSGIIDIASPLLLHSSQSSVLRPAARTSPFSFDTLNKTLGSRTVIAAGTTSAGSRALVLTDSAPFINYLFNFTQGTNEKRFVSSMVAWVAPASGSTIVFDNAHYSGPQAPKFQLGVPIGPLVTYALEQQLSGLDSYYGNLPSQANGLLGGLGVSLSDADLRAGIAIMLLFSVYAGVNRWFAQEKKGRDDQPAPNIEKTIVAESRARLDFLQTSKTKSFYVATLAQLYEVLDSIAMNEFGKNIGALGAKELAQKVGNEDAERALKLFTRLQTLHMYATGKKRFLFPPVLRWRALVARMTRDSELFLNRLGMTIAGEEQSKEKVEYAMREKVRV